MNSEEPFSFFNFIHKRRFDVLNHHFQEQKQKT